MLCDAVGILTCRFNKLRATLRATQVAQLDRVSIASPLPVGSILVGARAQIAPELYFCRVTVTSCQNRPSSFGQLITIDRVES
jgi:hypothetical protein